MASEFWPPSEKKGKKRRARKKKGRGPKKAEIQQAFGAPLSWERLDDSRRAGEQRCHKLLGMHKRAPRAKQSRPMLRKRSECQPIASMPDNRPQCKANAAFIN
jgi:hypothetical protein